MPDKDASPGRGSAPDVRAGAGEPDLRGIDRRQFLGVVAACSLGLTGAVVTGTAVAAVVPPSRSIDGKTKAGPEALVAVSDLPKDKPVPFEYGDDEVFVIRKSDEKILVLSAACPHVACRLHWDEAHNEFACPCHASFFTLEGVKKSGPAVRNMDPAVFAVQDGKVVVSGMTV